MNGSALTIRELDIVECLLDGQTAKQTARQLFISPRTVERHFENIKIKLQCRTKLELVNIIIQNNLFINNIMMSKKVAQ